MPCVMQPHPSVHSSITMTYDDFGHLFHDPAKDVDLMGEMEREFFAGYNVANPCFAKHKSPLMGPTEVRRINREGHTAISHRIAFGN